MRYIGLILLLTLGCSLFARDFVKTDTSAVVVRSMDGRKLETLKVDKDFRYEQTIESENSIWERFWNWLWYKIDQALSTKGGRITIWSVLIIVAVVIMGYFVFTVTGMGSQAIFKRTDKEGLSYDVASDDIHSISFDEAIGEAVSNGNFRLALRLLYLQSLKKLSDKGYIDWEINKTNSDYINEVSNKPWQEIFKMLTRRFEYTWYGDMKVEREDFERLQLQFQQFNLKL